MIIINYTARPQYDVLLNKNNNFDMNERKDIKMRTCIWYEFVGNNSGDIKNYMSYHCLIGIYLERLSQRGTQRLIYWH